MGPNEVALQLEALRAGHAYADLSAWRKVTVSGPDARAWLNDLLSADLSGLGPGRTQRSLLLSPTGRIRADLTVAATSVGTLLIQDPVQPTAIDRLLDPYVLSSGVDLADVTGQRGLLAFPGAEPPRSERDEVLRPSCLGPGADLLLPERRMAAGGDDLDGLVEVGPAALESWRIERGAARLGVDLGADSLPHEAGLDHAVAYRKGCFLGQEAVARVRNLGHPPFVVLAARARGPLARGEGVTADGGQAGTVTSVSPLGQGRSAAIVRVRWAARDATLRTDGDTVLETIGLASGIA